MVVMVAIFSALVNSDALEDSVRDNRNVKEDREKPSHSFTFMKRHYP